MDNDTLALLYVLGILILTAILFVLATTAAAAWSHTLAWQKKQKAHHHHSNTSPSSSSPFLPLQHSSRQQVAVTDNDDLDSSDLEEIEDAQAAAREGFEDVELTTQQKFWKEFREVWSAKRMQKVNREQRAKEREERRKLAREVVREFRRQGWKLHKDRDGVREGEELENKEGRGSSVADNSDDDTAWSRTG